MNRDPEHFNKLKGKKKLKEKKRKDITQHRGSKAIRAKAVSFASSRLFADQIHCLSHPKVTTPKFPSCSQWRCFPYWKKIYFDTPDAVLPKLPSVELPLAFSTCTIPCPQVKPRAKVTSGSAGTNLGSRSPSHWVSPRHQARLPATRTLSYPSPLASGKIWPKPKLIWQPSPGSCIAQSWCRLPAGSVCSNILSLRHPEATSLQENLLPCWGLVARQGKERKKLCKQNDGESPYKPCWLQTPPLHLHN